MGAKMAARDNAPTARLIDRLAPSSGARLKPGQSGELAADLVEGCGGNRGSPIADRMGQRVDAAHVAVRISPETGSPDGNTTLVPNGRTREVTGQTIANSVTRQKSAGETTSAGRRPLCSRPKRGSKSVQTRSPASGA